MLIQESVKNTRTFKNVGTLLLSSDVKQAAQVLFDLEGEDWYYWLDSAKDALEDKYGLDQKIISRLKSQTFRLETAGKKKVMNASPDRKVLKVLANAFTTSTLTPEDVTYITYQPRKSGGEIVRIDLFDSDSRLGHMSTSITDRDLSPGVKMEQVVDALSRLGANLQKRSKRRPRYNAYYD